jgi:tetratricopeptide (TPR) repeat protein
MASRACIVTLLTLFLTNFPSHAQTGENNSAMNANIAGLAGTVLNAEGRPVPGIHVELDDARTAVPVTSTYTQPDGTFELYNVPQGNYEVVAESAESEASSSIAVNAERPSLQLRLPNSTSAPDPLDATTSVARILVPPRAQKLYRRAVDYFNAGKYDEAEKKLGEALQIDAEYGDALTLRGLIDMRKPDISLGEQSLLQAIKVDGSQSTAYIALAAIYNHEGRFDDAERASQRGLALAPRTWQAYMEMAKASIAKSMYQSGLKFIRQAERLGGSTFAEVHLIKAYALVPMKLYKEARYELQASMARDRSGAIAGQAKTMLAKVDELDGVKTAANR